MVSLLPLIKKERILENLTKEDLLTLCECFQEELEKWKEQTESARNQLELLLGTKKCTEEEPQLLEVAEGHLVRCFYPNKEERQSGEQKKDTVNN